MTKENTVHQRSRATWSKFQLREAHISFFFLFLHKNICCDYALEASWWGASNSTTTYFSSRNKKIISTFWQKRTTLYLELWIHVKCSWLRIPFRICWHVRTEIFRILVSRFDATSKCTRAARMPRSVCTIAQSDQGLYCPRAESMDIVKYIGKQRKS